MSVTIYKDTEKLEDKIFKNPPSEYRGTPFWAWNGDLKEEYLFEQIEAFKKMGFGGAHMHIRTGFTQKYLGEEHMNMIKACTEKFKKEKMLSWLYDEDRWPSGAAGGYVTQDKKHRAKKLVITTQTSEETDENTLLACYSVSLDKDGYMVSYSRIGENDAAKEADKNIGVKTTKWYAYLRTDRTGDSWYNGQTYADTLSRDAIKKFIEVTYEAYDKTVGKDFGKAVPAIFTDEPNFGFKNLPVFSHDTRDIAFPWTTELVKKFKKTYGDDILDYLPEVFWELPEGKVSVHRYHVHDIITEMFTEAFSDQCGKWCDKHGIMLTGHVLWEGDLNHQTMCVGEAMRAYRGFGLPGIDMLCGAHEYSTAKQCQSAVHQFDRCGMVSELYGVTNWDFDFRGHKHHGDWQAALGVTTRVPHLAFYSMEGEAKRDYPASIGYQSPWYEKYSYIEDHFARVNTAMTRGKADVKVAVIHPIESMWLHYGPSDRTSAICKQMEDNFQNLIRWLIFGTVDFDYICESTFPQLCKKGVNPLKVGAMKYDVVIVPACETLRGTTLDRLEEFKAAGGKVIFMGSAPSLCDAVPSERGKNLFDQCSDDNVGFGKIEILNALSEVRDISIIRDDGNVTDNLIYQMRKEKNGTKWLFIANGMDYKNIDIPTKQSIKLTIKGKYTPTYYDTLSGTTEKIPFEIINGNTVITRDIYNHDSLLYRLDKYEKGSEGKASENAKALSLSSVCKVRFPSKVPYTLSEDNVYVLDMAQYKLNDGEWQDEEEILRLDTECRRKLGWPRMSGRMVQPWVIPAAEIVDFVTLRYTIESEIDVKAPVLAVERANDVKITLNGQAVTAKPDGYYVDRYIGKIALPELKKGTNILEIVCPIGRRVSVEYAYLLGSFGVRVVGREKTITNLPEKLAFDDIRVQGLPFYGANITYNCEVETDKNGILSIHAPVYRGSLVSVKIDGKECGNIVFSPYTIDIKGVKAGKHTVELTLYGNRFNCFGELHCHHNLALDWYGPDSFRTSGDQWSYEYETKPAGILRTPICELKK